MDVVAIVQLFRATYRKMIQNPVWATGYNVIAIPLAAGALYAWGVLLTPALGCGPDGRRHSDCGHQGTPTESEKSKRMKRQKNCVRCHTDGEKLCVYKRHCGACAIAVSNPRFGFTNLEESIYVWIQYSIEGPV